MISIEAILKYSVRELHIDLLLLEEFYSSIPFQHWFIENTVGLDKRLGALVRAEHSVFELERESDLEIAFQSTEGEILFLIENKINAQFQPEQAMDYERRAKEYVRRGKCIEAFSVLFAPHDYIESVKTVHKFHYYLSFEQVTNFFQSQTQMKLRANYKVEVLRRAIEKSAYKRQASSTSNGSTYQPTDVNEGITAFWEKYYQDITERIPELHMPKPGVKGPAATFIGLGKMQLPTNVIIYHKFVHGFVDLQFERLGERPDSFLAFFEPELDERMVIQKAGKSAVVIRMIVPKINPHRFYDELQMDVHQAQDAAKTLYDWFQKKINMWEVFRANDLMIDGKNT